MRQWERRQLPLRSEARCERNVVAHYAILSDDYTSIHPDGSLHMHLMSKTFSVSVRLKRVTIETAYVSVSLFPDLLEPNLDQSGTVDAEKLMQAAVRLGHQPSTVWTPEGEPEITPHPIQTPPD